MFPHDSIYVILDDVDVTTVVIEWGLNQSYGPQKPRECYHDALRCFKNVFFLVQQPDCLIIDNLDIKHDEIYAFFYLQNKYDSYLLHKTNNVIKYYFDYEAYCVMYNNAKQFDYFHLDIYLGAVKKENIFSNGLNMPDLDSLSLN